MRAALSLAGVQQISSRIELRRRAGPDFVILEFYIGLPAHIHDERLARVKPLSPWRGLQALRYTPPAMTLRMITPGSLLRRSFAGLSTTPNDRAYLEVEVPAGNGVGTARAIAHAYSVFAGGGAELGITPETMARITAVPHTAGDRDQALGVPSYFSLGFLRPGPDVSFGSSRRAFGAPGAGGSFGFADPDQRIGYAYVMNKLDFYLQNDPREKPLRDAVYRAIARVSAVSREQRTCTLPPCNVTQHVRRAARNAACAKRRRNARSAPPARCH